MRVLVTRPAREAAATAHRLQALGYTTVCAPVLDIIGLAPGIPAGGYGALMATSANAFGAGALPAWLGPLPLLLVGDGTLRAARAAGLSGAARVEPDARRLAMAHRARLAAGEGSAQGAEPSDTGVLYLAGRDRTPGLEQALRAAGIHVTTVETYAAEAVTDWDSETRRTLAAGIDAVLHYSQRSAETCLRLAARAGQSAALVAAHHICLSEKAAEPLARLAPAQVSVAATPDEQAMFAVLAAVAVRKRRV